VCGDLARVSQALNEHPELARAKGGARGWEPLLYLACARLPRALTSPAEPTARLLFERGADANAYYMAGDALYGTLVGVAGEGEQDAAPRPGRESLYRLLLEQGTEPFDIQALYNTHFRGDVLWWLQPTYDYTVSHGQAAAWADADWQMLDMGCYGNGARFLFWIAIQRNDIALATWLLEHGANPNAAPARAPMFSQRSVYDDAVDAGCAEIAAQLRAYGAVASGRPPSDVRTFVAACMRLDRAAAETLVRAHPQFRQSSQAMAAAIFQDRADVVSLLLELGTSPNLRDEHGVPALHRAAGRDARQVARLLLEHGADPDARDAAYDGTALGFAAYSEHRAMMAMIAIVSRDVRNLAKAGYVPRLREVLPSDPGLAREVREDMTTLWWLPVDDETALQVVDMLLAAGADASHVKADGETAMDVATRRGLTRAAARLGEAVARSAEAGPRI
jgi:ankyrin repeat protein